MSPGTPLHTPQPPESLGRSWSAHPQPEARVPMTSVSVESWLGVLLFLMYLFTYLDQHGLIIFFLYLDYNPVLFCLFCCSDCSSFSPWNSSCWLLSLWCTPIIVSFQFGCALSSAFSYFLALHSVYCPYPRISPFTKEFLLLENELEIRENTILRKYKFRTSLVTQWIRIHLPWVWPMVQEDATCLVATKAMHHNYWIPHT